MAKADFDAESARRHLAARDPALGMWMERIGPLPLSRPARFGLVDALGRCILYQQLHAKAAETIIRRVEALIGSRRWTAKALLALSEETLRGAGVSAAKARALRDLAEKSAARQLPSVERLAAMDDAAIVEALTQVRGIGPWTVQMLLIFHLGRPDVLPVSDYGIRAGLKLVHGLDELPDADELEARAEAWRPFRTLACRYLWRALEVSRQVPR
jgi:DNA-3-methyladenine glycosylase II